MKKYNLKFLIIIWTAILVCCSQNKDHMPLADIHSSNGSNQSSAAGGPFYESDIKPIINQYCLSCHGPGSGRDWTVYATFKAEQQKIETMVLGTNPVMPLGNPSAMPASARATLQNWINAGMPDFPPVVSNPSAGSDPSPGPTPVSPPGNMPMPTQAQLQSCTACHGDLGQSVNPIFPKLAAQTQPYLVNQLNAFHGKTRGESDAQAFMWPVAEILTPDDILTLANYFSTQAPDSIHEEGNADKIAKGKDIFNNGIADKGIPGCATCHGSQGEGMNNFPRLAGQFSEYISKQLNYFKSGARANDQTMPVFAKQLSDDDILNLSQYVNSL